MPTAFSDTTFSSTYKDDFKDSDNYHRILFRPGRALQARELTQLQTIIQKEMERFGRNIFKEGSVVNPGGLLMNPDYEFVKLQGTPTNITTGSIIEGGNITARVIEYVAPTSTDPATAYIEYTDVSSVTGGTEPIRFPSNTELTVTSGGTGTVTTLQASPGVPVVGKGFRIAVNKGAYFVQGHFVQMDAQSLIVTKYSNTPTATIGFIITEDIITSDDTDALYDNQNVEPNRTAPGADRYRIRLTLATDQTADSDDNFIPTNRFIDGILQEEIDRNTYNILGDEMAKRTFEESGNYVVEKFNANFGPNDDATKLTINVSPGISYVNGYRYAETDKTKIDVNKSRATEEIESEAISARYGNYILLDSIEGLPDVSTFERWALWNNTGGNETIGNTAIGTARIRQVAQSGGYYRFHLFDVNIHDPNSGFRDIRSIGDSTDASRYGNLVLEDSVAVMKEINHNNAFFELPRIRPQSVDVTGLTEQRYFTGTASVGTLNLGGLTTESYTDASLWIVTDDTGAVVANPTINVTSDGSGATITGLSDVAHEVVYYVNRESLATHRTKNLVEDFTDTGSLTNDELVLTHADIYQFNQVLDADSNDVTNRFDLDNGQRDNFYDRGKVRLQSGTVPQPIRVKYDYFQHGVNGDFFSANSYTGEVAYENIPTFRQNDGKEIELRNVLDFRSVKAADGTFVSNLINQFPRNTDTIQADVTYYQSRADILIATETGIKYIEGTPNVNPVKPEVPNNGMELYSFVLEPYTDDENDVISTYVDNRRYTMRDIGSIVKRIDNIEETVTLNLLELETSTVEVFDSAGNNRFKNGFFADNFKNHVFSDVFSGQYAAALDIEQQIITPIKNPINAQMSYNTGLSSNLGTVVKDDAVYLSYSETPVFFQNVATETENVNPFDVILYAGDLEISPEIDRWREDVLVGSIEIGGDTNIISDRRRSFIRPGRVRDRRRDRRGNDRNRPISRQRRRNVATAVVRPFPIRALPVIGGGRRFDPGLIGESRVLSSVTETTQTANSTVTTTTVRTLLGQRIVDIDLIPFVRSRRVFFRASQLAPNRQHFMFFDGVNIGDYIKKETYRTFGEVNPPDDFLGGEYAGLTGHPNTATPAGSFTTNEFGEIEGSFYIPNNAQLKFESGLNQVKILDVSVNDENAALSGAATNYRAVGIERSLVDVISTTVTRRVQPRPRPRPRPRPTGRRRNNGKRREPIAQSFQLQNTNGGFITSIEVFFASKSTSDVPIRLEVRPIRNGVPSQDEIIPGSVVLKKPADVSTYSQEQATDAGAGAMAGIRGTETKFTFNRPIYLDGYTEYCFVLIANTQEYTVWVAEIEQFLVGTTEKRVNKQPAVGSFFMSQNAITWTPDQRRDMMFRLNRAEFTTSGSFSLTNDSASTPTVNLQTDPLLTDSGDSDVTLIHPGHGFVLGDQVTISGFDSNTEYGGIKGSSLNGTKTLKKVDGYGYQFAADSVATATVEAGGSGVVADQNILVDEMIPTLDTFTLEANRASYNLTLATTLSLAQANNGTSSPYGTPVGRDIIPDEQIVFSSPRVIANKNIETQRSLTNSAKITGTFTTTDTWVSPVLDLQTASVLGISNIIDNQDSASGADNIVTNNPIEFINETDPYAGSAMSKHLTIPITLEQSAVGLKVLSAINLPTGSNVKLYYRTLEEGTEGSIEDQSFVYQAPDNLIGTDDNPSIFRQHEWTIGGQGGTLAEFSTFQLKIVMNSSNTSKVPSIKDLRAIALGT